MTSVRAIQTRYAGCYFRSRLEARWAVFFDYVGIEWQYEPEGFELGEYLRYLPDFWLPRLRMWLEVKGAPIANDDPWYGFIQERLPPEWNGRALLVYGDIPDPGRVEFFSAWPNSDQMWVTWPGTGFFDLGYQWTICPHCGIVGAEFAGRAERLACGCLDCKRDETYQAKHPRLLAAYRAARSARFEHGETPTA